MGIPRTAQEVNETYFGPLPPADSNTLSASLVVEDTYLNTLLTVPITLPEFFATEPGGFLPVIDDLALSTDVRPALGVVPFNVSVSGSSTGPGGAPLEWRFGDGNSSTLEATNHTYGVPGGYTLEGYASDPFGDRATSDVAIAASAPFGVVAGPSTGGGAAPLTVTFSASAFGGNGPPYGYNWSLPDGTTVEGPNLSLTLSSGGTVHGDAQRDRPGGDAHPEVVDRFRDLSAGPHGGRDRRDLHRGGDPGGRSRERCVAPEAAAYPLTTPSGTSRATRRVSPAPSATRTTSSTFL